MLLLGRPSIPTSLTWQKSEGEISTMERQMHYMTKSLWMTNHYTCLYGHKYVDTPLNSWVVVFPEKSTCQHAKTFQKIMPFQPFGNSLGKVLFRHKCARTASSIKTQFDHFGVEQPKWPVQNSELNPTEYLWDVLECTGWTDCKPGLLVQLQYQSPHMLWNVMSIKWL